MEFRKIEEKEQEQVVFVISQAFFSDCESEKKQIVKDRFRYEDFIGAFTENDKLVAIVKTEPHFMWLDGNSVKSGGICYVASLPEYRREGIISNLMKNTCEEMYDNQYVMSYLYPFSHTYYRKFGYELCCNTKVLHANPKDLLKLTFEGSALQFEPGEDGTDPEDIIHIYNAFASQFNIMLDRDAWQWEKHLEHDPIKTKTRTYIVYDKNKKANGYFTYTYDLKGHTAEINICDIAWIDYGGMYNLFAFIGHFFGNVKEIVLDVPPTMIPEFLWEEPLDITIKTRPNGMARVINAKMSLISLKKPTEEGEFSIKIHDEFLSQNNASYKVSWKDGKTEVKEYSGDCDIECSILALAQILTGFIGLDTANIRHDLIIYGNGALLKKVFIKRNVHLADFF